ncbi:hypothetical protein HK102_013547 [Quaeritorhiza haematococci]|nr:hypothetical protein HK102_013547 [Quaeritorhiza haematococci]
MPIVYFRLGGPIDQKAFTTEIYNGPIRAKDRFEVIYEPTRAKCEHAFESGVDSWAVHLAYQNTANQIHPDFALAAYVDPNSNSTVNPPIIIPPMNKTGKALFWFYCTNAVGQVEYDSNMGSNWEVEIVDG